MPPRSQNNRDSNVELLRIILMTMILLSHLITHGKYNFPDNHISLSISDSLILSLTRYHVNTFIIISGFFGISLKFRKIFNFITLVFFWTILGAIIDLIIQGAPAIHRIVLVLIDPFLSGWFIIQYFALLLYAPLLNKGLEVLSTKQFCIIICLYCLFVYGLLPSIVSISSPPTFQFIAMYLIGRLLKRFDPFVSSITSPKLMAINSILAAILSISVIMSRDNPQIYNRLLSNQDPLVILMGISLFLLFRKIRLGTIPFINDIASGVFVAYLLTDCTLSGRWLDKWIFSLTNGNAFFLIVLSLLLTMLCSALEVLRKRFLMKTEDTIYSRGIKVFNYLKM